jgi:hypothetical protein
VPIEKVKIPPGITSTWLSPRYLFLKKKLMVKSYIRNFALLSSYRVCPLAGFGQVDTTNKGADKWPHRHPTLMNLQVLSELGKWVMVLAKNNIRYSEK